MIKGGSREIKGRRKTKGCKGREGKKDRGKERSREGGGDGGREKENSEK